MCEPSFSDHFHYFIHKICIDNAVQNMITAEETTFKPQRKLGMTDEFSREN